MQKILRNEVHPQKGATIRLLDSFLRTALGGGSNAYYGTFPADMIPKHLLRTKRFQIIVNTSRTDDPPEQGGHFVCVEASPTHIVYIDPFGLPCQQEDIVQFILNCGREESFYSDTQIQHKSSVFCPLYCSLFVLYYHLKPSWNLDFSSSDLKSNEQRCIAQIKRHIRDPRLTPKKF